MTEIDCDERTVMRPKLVRIGDSCYRRLDYDIGNQTIDDYNVSSSSPGLKRFKQQTGQSFPPVLKHLQSNKMQRYLIDELERCEDDGEDYENEDTELKLNEGEEFSEDDGQGNLTLRLHVCSTFFGYIIGKRAQTKQSIESETFTFLKIPPGGGGGGFRQKSSQQKSDSFIQITGRTKRDLLAAQKRINSLVNSSRNKQNFSHFLSIPLGVDQSIREKFNEFKQLVCSDPNLSVTKNIDESVFQVDTRLHLTVRIFYLGDQYERDRAIKLLEQFNHNFLQDFLKKNNLQSGDKLKLRVKGLNMMNDDPSAVNVLYANVEEVDKDNHRGLLKTILDSLFDWFETSGLTISDRNQTVSDSKVKIHCTLMNTRYRYSNRNKSVGSGSGDQRNDGGGGGEPDPNDDVAEVEAEMDDNQPTSSSSSSSKRYKRKSLKMDCTNVLDRFGDFDFGTIDLRQIHFSSPRFFDSETGYYMSLGKIEF